MALYRHVILSLGVALVAMPAPAAAQRSNVQPNRWNLDYGDVRCSLSRRISGPQSPILILSSYLGRDEPEIILMRDGAEDLPDLPNAVEVVLAPANHVARGEIHRRQVQGGRIVTLRELGEGFIDRFAEAGSIRFQARGRPLIDMTFPGAAAAVTALKECNEDLLRSWGVDTTIPISRRPRHRSGSIRVEDYPSRSIERGEQGVVVVRFIVNTQGRAEACRAAVSSTYPTLDQHTCAIIAERHRFHPAEDDQGRPVPGLYVQTVRWVLPEG